MTYSHPDWRFDHTLRPIAPIGLWRIEDWSIKAYAIAGVEAKIAPKLVETAKMIARTTLPHPGVTPKRYGAGFVIVHEAQAFNTVAVDWWQNINELNHRFFRAPAGASDFADITATGESACVWELHVQAHERNTWLTHVLRDGRADLEQYFQEWLSEMA
ncbi:MAG: hypothetical protein ABL889_10210 [Terricaulis sp.]